MKISIVIFLISILFISLSAQDLVYNEKPTIMIYASQILIGNSRTDIAIGAPLFNDNIYYAFYLTKIPGLRLEYKIAGFWVTGLSLMDDAGIYFFRYHFGFKISKHFMISESFTPKEGGLELVYFF